MRTVIVLCSMILLFSFTGVQAQTDSVPVAGDSLQTPASTASSVPETPAPKTAAVIPTPIVKTDNSLTGVKLFFCSGLYFYNKSTVTETDYDWYTGATIEYEVTYKTYLSAVLLNASFMVNNGFSIGATMGVLSISSKRETDYQEEYSFYEGNSGTSVNIIGPRVAYYYGKKDSKVLPFAAFEYDLLTSDFYSDNAIRIGAGVLLQPKPHFGISFGLDYLKLGDEEKSTNIMGVLGLTGIIY